MKTLINGVCLSVFLLLSGTVFAIDGVRIAAGQGEVSTDVYKISLLKNFDKTWFKGRLKGHWELGFSHWDSNSSRASANDIQGISFAPVFIVDFWRLGSTGQPYVEYSLGVLYINDTVIADNEMGQRWQFDHRLGIGVRFGSAQHHDLSVSVRHASNARADDENDGFNSAQLAYTYRF